MKRFFPTPNATFAQSGWPFLAFFALPVISLALFFRSTFPSAQAHWWAFSVATLLSVPASVWLFRRTNRLVKLGLHPHYSELHPMPSRDRLYAWLGVFLGCYSWTLAVVMALVWLPLHPMSEQAFDVAETRQCIRKCFGCYHEAKLSSWPGLNFGSICVESFVPLVQAGERLVVSGRFSPFGVYVQSLRRTTG